MSFSSKIIAIILTSLTIGTSLAVPVPANWLIDSDDFESGSLASYDLVNSSGIAILSGIGRSGGRGLQLQPNTVATTANRAPIARSHEGYLSFWVKISNLDLGNTSSDGIAPSSIFLATVRGVTGSNLVGLRLWDDPERGFMAYLQWTQNDDSWVQDFNGQFTIPNDGEFHKITIGYSVDDFVAVWLDSIERRRVHNVSHRDTFAHRYDLGDLVGHGQLDPGGTLVYDDVEFRQRKIDHLYVDASGGNDANSGGSIAQAFRTISRASDSAGPGTTVHILPGIYRETLRPALDGWPAKPTIYRAENGPNTVFVRGSVPSSALSWTQLSSNTLGFNTAASNIWWTDLSSFDLDEQPRYVVQLSTSAVVKADVSRLYNSREPDYRVDTEWKDHEFWFAADGGHMAAACNPLIDADPDDCDQNQRARLQLTDRTNDGGGIEAGHLGGYTDLTGATLFALDCVQGNTRHRRTITNYFQGEGKISIAKPIDHPGSATGGLGWGTKYYLEDHPELLDSPGEWYFDPSTNRFYLYSPSAGSPVGQKIEIAVRDSAVNVSQRSNIHFADLNFEIASESLFKQTFQNDIPTNGHQIQRCDFRYADRGIEINQIGTQSLTMTDGFTVIDSEISHTDSQGIYMFSNWSTSDDPSTWNAPGITNVLIQDNHIHHNGFAVEFGNGVGIQINRADRVNVIGNTIERTAQSGIFFDRSVVDSTKQWGFSDSEIKIGKILVKDNLIQNACLQSADCGALRFWGQPPDSAVFRDVLIYGNTLRDTFAYSDVSLRRGKWDLASQSGMSGSGIYFDRASGAYIYRNTSYNNPLSAFRTTKNWRDGRFVFYNNIAANSAFGWYADGKDFDTHAAVEYEIKNNILSNLEGFGYVLFDPDGVIPNLSIDRNLYYETGWNQWHVDDNPDAFFKSGVMAVFEKTPNDYYRTLGDMKSVNLSINGIEGDPHFSAYQGSDHDVHDCSIADFHLADSSPAIDSGTFALDNGLYMQLLANGIVDEVKRGSQWDIGRFEHIAQPDFSRFFGSSAADGLRDLGRGRDQSYYLAGFDGTSGSSNALVTKVRSNGSVEWSATLGGGSVDVFNGLAPTSDGGVVVAGQGLSFIKSGLIAKYDSEGRQVFASGYGGWPNDYFNAVIEVCDGFVAAGTTKGLCKPGSDSCAWLIKTDRDGNRLWVKTAGGLGPDVFHDLIQTADGNIVVVGGIYIPADHPAIANQRDSWAAWVLKYDQTGTRLWSRVIGLGGDEEFYGVTEDAEGNLLVVGYTDSFGQGGRDGTLMMLDTNGRRQWWRAAGGAGDDELRSVYFDDQQMISVGSKDTVSSKGLDAWALVTNLQGQTLSSRTFGSSGDETFHAVTQSHNDGAAFGGDTSSYGSGNTDAWLKLVDPS